MSATFYRAFEDRYRGSRELIIDRLQIYLPFVSPLKSLYEECPVLDLGCGRGEWLELLQTQGFLPRGVDLDESMLQACQYLDLPVELGDALATLATLEDESQVVVSAFHLIEHIPFATLQALVSEALRVLKPAGLLIMETPNAENLVVGTNIFYLDPTHERPLPHLLVSFLTEYSGFARSKLVRLQEPAALHDLPHLTLMDVLGRASPDYAIIAQKAAEPACLAVFDQHFERDYGLSLEDLAERYEQQLEQRFQAMFDKLCLPALQQQEINFASEWQSQDGSLEVEMQQDEDVINEMQQHDDALEIGSAHQNANVAVEWRRRCFKWQRQCTKLEAELQRRCDEWEAELLQSRQQRDEALAKAHDIWLQGCADNSRLQALLSSRSWRVTAPLRGCRKALGWLSSSITRVLKGGVSRMVGVGGRFVLRHPALTRRINAGLKRFPCVYEPLKRYAYNRGLLGSASVSSVAPPINLVPQHLDGLSESARNVYHDLKKTIDQKDLR
ncbi:putative S-adenosylmethionine-dependent methyltransferase [compost metagenome]